MLLDRIKSFVSLFRLFAPTIEEYANQVEADKTIDAGNSFCGILYEIGKLLEAFKELIKEGLWEAYEGGKGLGDCILFTLGYF